MRGLEKEALKFRATFFLQTTPDLTVRLTDGNGRAPKPKRKQTDARAHIQFEKETGTVCPHIFCSRQGGLGNLRPT